jgi:hypothetical protein
MNEYPTGFYPGAATNYIYRNTIFWSKLAMARAAGKYESAQLTHWLHTPGLTQTAGVIENQKEALELPARLLGRCRRCGYDTSVTAGTVLHRTKLPLRRLQDGGGGRPGAARASRPSALRRRSALSSGRWSSWLCAAAARRDPRRGW